MKHIGIHQYSVEGAVLCYHEMLLEGQRRLGEHEHPIVTVSGLAMAPTLPELDRKDFPALRARTAEVVDRLAAAGAGFFCCPDNSIHIAFEFGQPDFAIPCLHIAEVVADTAVKRGHRKVGILGTNWTMQGPVFPRALGARGIDWAVPPAETRAELHRIIMDELCPLRIRPESVDYYRSAIDALKTEGCDSVALVCTEIPLIISDENSALPVLDSTRLLAHAAIDVALGVRPLPTWHGGPLQG